MEGTSKLHTLDRHKKVECKLCFRVMRSDKLNRHMLKHRNLYDLDDDEIRSEIKRRKKLKERNETRKEREQRIIQIAAEEEYTIESSKEQQTSAMDIISLEEELHRTNSKYIERIELGEKIAIIISKGSVREESLTKNYKEALDLYRKQRPRFNNILAITLRSWQEQALQLITSPTERKIIWLTGRQGNEGKSWFQCYIEAYYGFHRVTRIDLRIGHANICQVLKKQSLASIDIFLFNDSRSVAGDKLNFYRILEDIKDGLATTSKYNNVNIRFKTPNTLLVFSNIFPNTKKLSRDRWEIYDINSDKLANVSEQVINLDDTRK